MSSHKKYSWMNKLPGLRSVCKIMNCGITASPCENTQPSPGAWLVQRRVTVTVSAVHSTLFSTRVSQEEGEVFFLTHQRQFMLYISCVRRTVVWRESDSQWNTVAYSIILVVMETAELTKSVKWLQGLSVTKLLEKMHRDKLEHLVRETLFKEYSTYPFI